MYQHNATSDDLTVTQAARLLGVSVRTVQRACDDGAIAHRRESNGYRRITRAAVEAYQRGTMQECAA